MRTALLNAWMRLFTLQGSWTHDRLQGIGTGFASEPLLRDLPGGVNGEAYAQGMGRAVRYFNTHPYLAGLAVGAIARAEHLGCAPARIDRLRSALKGPLGSIGDRLVWAGALPLASAVGVSIAVGGHPILAAATFLLLFNLVHLTLRFWALRTGWSAGLQVVKALSSRGLQLGLRVVGPVSLLALGFMIPVLFGWALGDFAVRARTGIILVASAALLVLRWLAPTLGAARLGILMAAAAILGGWLWPT